MQSIKVLNLARAPDYSWEYQPNLVGQEQEDQGQINNQGFQKPCCNAQYPLGDPRDAKVLPVLHSFKGNMLKVEKRIKLGTI